MAGSASLCAAFPALTNGTMTEKLQAIYYSPRGYWQGEGAVKKVAKAAGVSNEDTRDFL